MWKKWSQGNTQNLNAPNRDIETKWRQKLQTQPWKIPITHLWGWTTRPTKSN
jgi:hypothetical protein